MKGDIRAIRGLFQRFFTRVQFIYTVDRAREHYSVAEAELKIVRKVYTLVLKEDQHFLYHGERTIYPLRVVCAICFDNNASEGEVIEEGEPSNFMTDLSKMQTTEFPCPQRHHYVTL